MHIRFEKVKCASLYMFPPQRTDKYSSSSIKRGKYAPKSGDPGNPPFVGRISTLAAEQPQPTRDGDDSTAEVHSSAQEAVSPGRVGPPPGAASSPEAPERGPRVALKVPPVQIL